MNNTHHSETISDLMLFAGIQGPTFDAIKLAMSHDTYTSRDYFYALESTTLETVDTILGAMITLGLSTQLIQHGRIYLTWNQPRFLELTQLYESNPQFLNLAGKAERDASTPKTSEQVMRGRIFNNPSHPQYGPVRRMWVILNQLNLLDFLDGHYFSTTYTWDSELAGHIAAHNQRESATFAFYLYHWLRIYRDQGGLGRATIELQD